MTNEKNKIEALLFASASRMKIEEISKITGISDLDKIKIALTELKAEIEERGASMSLQEDNGYWRFTVKDHYMPMLNKVLTQAELDKPLMETLAVIAWKYPVLQADVVKIRHNKAYEHLKQLQELGFISRYRFGRTNKITLTNKFFEYFDLPSPEKAKELFDGIMSEKVKQEIEKSEQEIDEAEKKIEIAKDIQEEMKKEKDSRKEPMPDKPNPGEPNPVVEEGNGLFDDEDSEEEPLEPMPDKPQPGEPNPVVEEKEEENENVSNEMSEVQEQDELPKSDN